MAKSRKTFDNPLEELQKLREERQGPPPEATPRRERPAGESRPGRRKNFTDPLDRVSRGQAARATREPNMVGNYKQRNFRLPPEFLELIREIALVEQISIADAERWVVYRGLVAYYEDSEQPQFQQTYGRQVLLPPINL